MFENERCIPVTNDEYQELVKKAERIATVERFINKNKYVTVEEILALLDVSKRIESEVKTND